VAEINLELSWEDYHAWRSIPATEEFFLKAGLLKRNEEQAMGRGATLDCNCSDSTQGNTARVVGIVKGIELMLNLKPAGESTEPEEE